MDIIVSQLMTGLSIASILMLVALGLAVIYGVTGVINLAHGEFVMLGAYAAWALQTEFGMGLLARLVPIFIIMAAGGSIGPTLFAFLTQKVFGDEMMLRYAILTSAVVIFPLAAANYWVGLKSYRHRILEMRAAGEPV